jgi:hypothetical protein
MDNSYSWRVGNSLSDSNDKTKEVKNFATGCVGSFSMILLAFLIARIFHSPQNWQKPTIR